ncbi:MAG: 3,4-dihydroxy-2-butanone-4-phosphate synthase, partial [Bdellovibrio sp.]
RSPGHIFPLRAQSGGVLKRPGHTEGSVDLARLAGLTPAAVICEVMNEDGSMARVPDLFSFAEKRGIKIGTIVDLIEHRLQNELLVEETNRSSVESQWGSFQLKVFRSRLDAGEHLVLQKGELGPEPTLVRVQVQHPLKALLGVLSGQSMETGLQGTLELLAQSGGVLVLLSPGQQSFTDQVQALLESRSPFPMDERNYGTGAQILRALGLKQLKLISQNTHSPRALRGFDLEIVEWVAPPIQSQGDTNEAWNRSLPIQ